MYTFEEIVGNEIIIKSLQNSIKNNKIYHSYIFNGDTGMGKKLLAKTFAKTIQCEKKDITPCNKCVSCKSFDTSNHPDIIYIHPAKTTIGVEEVREKINKNVEVKPYRYEYKIIIVDRASDMTHAAQNAILKTIENPPKYAVFLFLSTNINKFLPTVLSRCIVNNLKPLSNKEVLSYLKDNFNIKNDLLNIYVTQCQGNLGYINKLISQDDFINIYNDVIDIIVNLENNDLDNIFLQFKNIEQLKDNIDDVLNIMYLYLRDAIIAKELDTNYILQKDKETSILSYINNLTLKSLINKLNAVCEARQCLIQNSNFQMTIEVMLLKLKQS